MHIDPGETNCSICTSTTAQFQNPGMYKVANDSEKSARVHQLNVISIFRMPLDMFLIIWRKWTAKHVTSGQLINSEV